MDFKIILYGPSFTGAKTSLLERIVNNKFEIYLPTVGVDFTILNIESKYGIIKLMIWDCAGQKIWRNILKSYFKGVHCIILGYDITNKKSYEETKKSCYDFIIDNLNKDNIPLFYLVANKIDLHDEIEIPDKDALSFAKEKKMEYFKISAKTGEGVDLLLNHIVNSLIKKYMQNIIKKDINFKLIKEMDKWLLIEAKKEKNKTDFIKLKKCFIY